MGVRLPALVRRRQRPIDASCALAIGCSSWSAWHTFCVNQVWSKLKPVGERLVLTVKQWSPLELVDHHCGDEVEIGAAATDPSSIGGGQGRF